MDIYMQHVILNIYNNKSCLMLSRANLLSDIGRVKIEMVGIMKASTLVGWVMKALSKRDNRTL
jgi:hypothetical protein